MLREDKGWGLNNDRYCSASCQAAGPPSASSRVGDSEVVEEDLDARGRIGTDDDPDVARLPVRRRGFVRQGAIDVQTEARADAIGPQMVRCQTLQDMVAGKHGGTRQQGALPVLDDADPRVPIARDQEEGEVARISEAAYQPEGIIRWTGKCRCVHFQADVPQLKIRRAPGQAVGSLDPEVEAAVD